MEPDGPNRYRIHRDGRMNVDVRVYANEPIKRQLEQQSLDQLSNAASLDGVRYVAGMPDLHVGYGLPVGGVMGMDPEEGLISAGAVGMDINCGVRLMRSPLNVDDLDRRDVGALMNRILDRVPVGVGKDSPHMSTLRNHLDDVLVDGVAALIPLGFAKKRDLETIQDGGRFPGARPDTIGPKARDRTDQLGTLGGGNHFIEIEAVNQVYDPERAAAFGLQEGDVCVMIHTGSRGFGHQNCVDYSDRMKQRADELGVTLPDRGLAAAPVDSDLGRDYLGAMACGANMAYANRQMIGHEVREAFREVLSSEEDRPETVYDITHNLARFESFNGDRMLMHRKGAIRALPAGHPENPDRYRDTGHPVLIPGNMKVGSYVLTAGEAVDETHHSVNHGAGRVMSRTQAKETFSARDLKDELGAIQLGGSSANRVRDEAPGAYKNVDEVIRTLESIDVIRTTAHLRPLAVIKGD